MGLYSRYVFPWVLDKALGQRLFNDQRRLALVDVAEPVLELGFGTGLNLPHYPSAIRSLSIVEPNAGSLRRAETRIAASRIEVAPVALLPNGRLAAPDQSFASVVSTWTLCSIADVPGAIAEIRRVLRPGGRFFFLEHGLAPDLKVARWQRRLNGIQRILGDGCHLDRDIPRLVAAPRLAVEACAEYYLEKVPKLAGYMYRGVARKGE